MDSWTESAPGTFTKEFDGEERVYRAASTAFSNIGKEHWSIYCVCSFSLGPAYAGTPIQTALREAWKALRFEYPGLSVVPDCFTKVYTVPDAQAVDDWADRTFFCEPTRSADEIVGDSSPNDMPRLSYLSASSELLFQSSHWRIDAVGTCMLLDRLFCLLAKPRDLETIPWAQELQNMSPSMEDAVGPAEAVTPEVDQFARQVIDNFHKNTLQNCGLPYKGDKMTPPARSSRQAVTFTKESTSALVSASKARNISVTAMIHAALAETAFALSPDRQSDYTTVVSVNLRKYVQPRFRTKAHACSTCVTSITPRVLRDSNFADRMAALARDYNSWYSAAYMSSLRQIYKYHSDAVLARRDPPATPPSGVFLSSLGVVEQYISGSYGNAVRVDGFRFGVSMMTRQVLLYPWTFAGQLSFSVNYNEAYHDAGAAREVITRVQAVLETELGVKLEQTSS